jgi:hypothetical protein
MAQLVRAIHFPEALHVLHRFWKMDGRHKGGHDGFVLRESAKPDWVARFCGP